MSTLARCVATLKSFRSPRSNRHCFQRNLSWALLCLAAVAAAQAPVAHYTPSAVTLGGGFSNPRGVAVDPAGNVYVADTGNNAVKKVPAGCLSSTCVITMAGFNAPQGVSVNIYGDIDVADTGNNMVKQMRPGCSSATCAGTLASGLNTPTGVAEDKWEGLYVADTGNNSVRMSNCGLCAPVMGGFDGPKGVSVDMQLNVFVTDTGNNVVKEIPADCRFESCVTTLAGAFNSPSGIAVDFGQSIYVADTGNNRVAVIPPGCASSSCVATVEGGFNGPAGVAVDLRGNIYVADAGNNAVKMIPFRSVQLPNRTVQSTSSVTTLTFTFDSGGSIGAPAVLTMGASGLDFADAGTGSCTSNGPTHIYSPGDTCTVDVTFTPLVPGMRKGAVQLVDTSAAHHLVASELIFGYGIGPNVSYSVAGQTVLFSGLDTRRDAHGVAVDGSGNIYLTDPADSTVKKIPPGCASSSCATILGGGFTAPVSIALDGAGNLYVADTGALKEIPAGCASATCVTTLAGGVISGIDLTVDASGTVYVAAGSAWKIPAGCTGYACMRSEGHFSNAGRIAVDDSGNFYVNDPDYWDGSGPRQPGIEKFQDGCQSSICIGEIGKGAVDGNTSLAVDSVGSLYFVNAVDTDGNLYGLRHYVYTGSGSYGYQLIKTTRTVKKVAPTVSAWPEASDITYGQTLASSTLSDGAASAPGTFTWTTPSTAPGLGSHEESVTFTPTDLRDYNIVTGTVTVMVNKIPPTVSTWPTASAITYGQTLASSTLTGGTASVPGAFAWTMPSTIPGGGLQQQSVTFTPTDTTYYDTATSSVMVTVNKAAPTVSAWPTANSITYGQTLASSALTGGTASVAGTFAWTTPATAPGAGSKQESVTFTPTDAVDYTTAAGTVTVVVNQVTPTITWSAPAAIAYGTPLSSAQLNATANVAGAFVYSPAAGTLLGGGTQTLSTTFTPTDAVDYTTATASVTLTVNPLAPVIALSSSLNPADVAQSVTFTATVSSPAGLPTGAVTFYDGPTQIGAGTLAAGSGTYATSTLAAGSHSITAQYSGDANFTPVTSAAVTQTIRTVSIEPATGTQTTLTTGSGGAVDFALTVTPPGSTAATVTAAGLPQGFIVSVVPGTINAGAGPTRVEIVVHVPGGNAAAATPAKPGSSLRPVALSLILLPLFALRRSVRRGRRLLLFLILAVGVGASLAVTGCGSNLPAAKNNTKVPPGAYTLTVTATAGAESKSVSLTLNIVD